VCEGDSRRERGPSCPPGGAAGLTDGIVRAPSQGQNSPVHGLPRRPGRKPTGRNLFPVGQRRRTKTERARGLVAAEHSGVNVPAPIGWTAAARIRKP
jgi:hypothetical protein